MPPAVFERHRAAVESVLLKAETRLDERTARYWNEIDRENYEFDRRERLREAVGAVTRDDLENAWRDLVTAPETARGVVVVVSNREPPASGQAFRGAEVVADAGAFKRSNATSTSDGWRLPKPVVPLQANRASHYSERGYIAHWVASTLRRSARPWTCSKAGDIRCCRLRASRENHTERIR